MEEQNFKIEVDFNLFTHQDEYVILMRKKRFLLPDKWVEVKRVTNQDSEYARNSAEEILYYLEREE